MKRFADGLARQRGIKPPPGYKASMSICRAFLNQHAPKKADGEKGTRETKSVGPAQIVGEETTRDGNLGIPTEATVSLPAIPETTGATPVPKRPKRIRKTKLSTAPKSTVTKKRSVRRKAGGSAPPTAARQNSEAVALLRIPYGNKEVALRLGARYGAKGWYAPPGVDLSAFVQRGWL